MPILDLPQDPLLTEWPKAGRIGILDLEFTAWDGSLARGWSEPWEWREVIQCGLLAVDVAAGFAPLDGVEVMVRPQRNPQVSDYFTNLTGITQERVEAEGVPFAEALARLDRLMATVELVIFNGADGMILRENCAFLGLDFPWPDKPMVNFRPLLRDTLDTTFDKITSSGLPELAGLPPEGEAHTALDDCRAIARAFGHWRSTGVL